MVLALARLATILPRYAFEASDLLASFTMLLATFGISAPQASSITGALDLQRVAGWVTSLLRGVVGFGANVALLLSLLLFLGIESTGVGSRMAALTQERPALGQALRDFARNTRRFLGVTTVFGFITGFADTLLLLALDIPLALLWGLLAAVCNYIPYVGFIIGLVPPALLAQLVGDWQLMLVVIVSYIVLNSLFTSLIQPYFVGDAVGISMTVTFLALVFWAYNVAAGRRPELRSARVAFGLSTSAGRSARGVLLEPAGRLREPLGLAGLLGLVLRRHRLRRTRTGPVRARTGNAAGGLESFRLEVGRRLPGDNPDLAADSSQGPSRTSALSRLRWLTGCASPRPPLSGTWALARRR